MARNFEEVAREQLAYHICSKLGHSQSSTAVNRLKLLNGLLHTQPDRRVRHEPPGESRSPEPARADAHHEASWSSRRLDSD